jgi:hypothetical protein
MQAPRGKDVQHLLIIDLGTRCGLVVSVTLPTHFTPAKNRRYPWEAGWGLELVIYLCLGSNPGRAVCVQMLH